MRLRSSKTTSGEVRRGMMHQRNFYRVRRVALLGFLLVASASLLAMISQQRATAVASDKPATAVGQTSSAHPKLHVMDLYGHQPLSFERNDGQTDAQVKFISRGDGYTLFLTSADAVLALRRPGTAADVGSKPSESKPEKVESETLRIRLVGANPGAQIEATDQLAGKSNYFVGKDPPQCHTNIPPYTRTKYTNL